MELSLKRHLDANSMPSFYLYRMHLFISNGIMLISERNITNKECLNFEFNNTITTCFTM